MENIARDVDNCVKQLKAENDALHQTIDTLQKALFIAGRYARDWLPAEVPKEHYEDYLRIMTGGAFRDPKGAEFIEFWLKLAQSK